MKSNCLPISIFFVVIGSVVFYLLLRPEPRFTKYEAKVGDLVTTDYFMLKVTATENSMFNVTEVEFILRNITKKPIYILTTDRMNKLLNTRFKKFFTVIRRAEKTYSTFGKDYIIEPTDSTGNFDKRCRLFVEGEINRMRSAYLIISRDPEGTNVVCKIKL